MVAEPESLATSEGLDAHIRRHAYDRLLMLSDGVFAIAVTLAALEIRPAEGFHGDLLDAIRRPILAYGISFLLTGMFWLQHRNLFARLRRVDMPLTALTLALLCVVAVIPTAARMLYAEHLGDEAFRFYSATMGVCGAISWATWLYVAVRPGLLHPDVPQRYRWRRVTTALALPAFVAPMAVFDFPLAAYVQLGALAVLITLRRIVLPRVLKRLA